MARLSKEADRAYDRAYRARHREKYCEKSKRFRREHPESVSETNRKSQLRFYYGITVEDYNRLLTEQGGRCAICRAATPNNGHGDRHFDVDHDHKADKVRGLLCRACNALIGRLESDPALVQAAYAYLVRYGQKDPY